MDVFQAAKEARKTPETIRRWIREEKLPARKNEKSGEWEIDPQDLHLQIESSREKVIVETESRGFFSKIASFFGGGKKNYVEIARQFDTIEAVQQRLQEIDSRQQKLSGDMEKIVHEKEDLAVEAYFLTAKREYLSNPDNESTDDTPLF